MKNLSKVDLNTKLEEIENFFKDYEKNQNWNDLETLSLIEGKSGIILVQALYYQITGSESWRHEIIKGFDQSVEVIEQSEYLLPSFCNGLAGWAWLFIYLSEHKIISYNARDFLADIDSYLRKCIDVFISDKNFDILHGAVGIGLYFLKRGNIKIVSKIILALEENMQVSNEEIKWATKFNNIENFYDFGLAHGNASILFFLGKCYAKNIQKRRCAAMIRGIVIFYMNNLQDHNKIGSYFPYKINVKDYYQAHELECSRLAWCYGDLGILHTLLLVSEWINDYSLKEKIVNMLIATALRKDLDGNRILDAGFCHGTSGVGLIFLSLYKRTNNIIFKETAEFWLSKTLEYGNNTALGTSVGYLFEIENIGRSKANNILNGIAGVALFLLAFNYNPDNDWAECLFIA